MMKRKLSKNMLANRLDRLDCGCSSLETALNEIRSAPRGFIPGNVLKELRRAKTRMEREWQKTKALYDGETKSPENPS